jgi:sulfite exporter TauE/SafE
MAPDVTLLVLTAASIGLVHTLLGPDHYLPFVALSKARGWSVRRTVAITSVCGVGHLVGSIALGAAGIAAGTALDQLVDIESFRGDVAAWLLFAFGLAYAAWGLKRALRGDAHSHEHFHADGTRHSHHHDHRLAPHLHPHTGDCPRRGLSPIPAHAFDGDSPLRGQSPGQSPAFTIERVEPVRASGLRALLTATPWTLFIIFAFGPCEPLIPVLMYPASHADWPAVIAVGAAFGLATLGTMLSVVLLACRGLQSFDGHRLERWSHSIAGGTITACAAGMLWLGL